VILDGEHIKIIFDGEIFTNCFPFSASTPSSYSRLSKSILPNTKINSWNGPEKVDTKNVLMGAACGGSFPPSPHLPSRLKGVLRFAQNNNRDWHSFIRCSSFVDGSPPLSVVFRMGEAGRGLIPLVGASPKPRQRGSSQAQNDKPGRLIYTFSLITFLTTMCNVIASELCQPVQSEAKGLSRALSRACPEERGRTREQRWKAISSVSEFSREPYDLFPAIRLFFCLFRVLI
jgi:hypothetical protein